MKSTGNFFLLVYLVLFFCISAFSQEDTPEIIKDLIKKSEIAERIDKACLLNNISKEYLKYDPGKSMMYADMALKSANTEKNEIEIINALINKGLVYNFNFSYDTACMLCNEARKRSLIGNFIQTQGYAYVCLAQVYINQGLYDSSLFYLNRVISIGEEQKNIDLLFFGYKYYTKLYLDKFDMKEALAYNEKYLMLAEKEGNNIEIGEALINMGMILNNQNEIRKSIEYCEKAWMIASKTDVKSLQARVLINLGVVNERKDRKKGLSYYFEALEILDKTHLNNLKCSALINIGFCYTNLGKYEESGECFKKALVLANQSHYPEIKIKILLNLGLIEGYKNNFIPAYKYAELGLELSRQHKMLKNQKLSIQLISEIAEAQRDYSKALDYRKQMEKIQDSINRKDISNRLAEFLVKYETMKKEKENAVLVKEKEILQLQVYIISLGLLLIITVILLIFFRQRIRHKYIVLKNNQLNNELEYKKRELTDFAMYISMKNELLQEIKDKLQKDKQSELINHDIVNMINQNLTMGKDITELLKKTEQINQEKYTRLIRKYPDLNDEDIQLSGLVMLGLSAKEIASILNITIRAAEARRYRLRKKLNIENSDINLTEYLKQN